MLRKSSVEVFERVARHALAYDPTVGPEAEESCVAVLHELVDFYPGCRKGSEDGDAPSGCPSCGSVGGAPVGWEAGGVAWMDRRGRYEVERLAEHDEAWLRSETASHEARGFKTYGVVRCKSCGAVRYLPFKQVAKEAAKNSARITDGSGKGRA